MTIDPRTPMLVGWFFRRMLSAAGGRIVAATLAGGMGTAATLGSIWMIVALVVDLQGDRGTGEGLEISIQGRTIVEGVDFTTAIVAIGLVAIMAAVLQYMGELLGLSAASAVVRRIRAEAARACSGSAGDRMLGKSQAKSIVSFIQVVSRECGMAAVQLARVPLSVVTALACTGLLTYLAPALLLVLCVIAPFYILAISLLNRRSHRDHLEHGRTTDLVRAELLAAMGEADRRHASPGVVLAQDPGSDVAKSDRIMFGRIALVRKVTLANAIATTLVIMAMLVSMRADLLGLEGDWGRLLVVLFVLRYLAASIRQASIAFNVTRRFTESIGAARGLEDPPPSSLEANELPEGLVILSKRIDRIQAIRGLTVLEEVEPAVAPGAVRIDLVRESLEDLSEPTVVDPIAAAGSTESLGGRPIVVMARNRAAVEAFGGRGFRPRTVADLRVDPPVARPWSEITDDTDGIDRNTDETDDIDLLEDEV